MTFYLKNVIYRSSYWEKYEIIKIIIWGERMVKGKMAVKKRLKYEKPELLDLGGAESTLGAGPCESGTKADEGCNSGTQAVGTCLNNGVSATGYRVCINTGSIVG